MTISIAIDGPAGAGKSTIAKLLAEKLNYIYINTGAMYRAVTLMAMRENISYKNVKDVYKLVQTLDIYFKNDNIIVNNEDITDEITMPKISNNVSNYAAIPEVREILINMQREIAKENNVVMDGRDIGTIVLKDADIKFFLNASIEKRAERRLNQLQSKNIDVKYDDILHDLNKRDYIDIHRDVGPLIKANDAIEIDSSDMSIEEVVKKMSDYIKERIDNI